MDPSLKTGTALVVAALDTAVVFMTQYLPRHSFIRSFTE